MKIYLLFDIYKRLCEVLGHYLDFYFWLKNHGIVRWGYTEHFHTALKFLPFFKKKSHHPALRTDSPDFLRSNLKTKKKKKNIRTWWSLSLQPVCHCTWHVFINLPVPVLQCFISFYAREARFYFPHDVCRGPNQWQIFRPLVFTRTPGCFARQSGQSLALDLGHSELDQLHWLHKWLTRLKSLLWSPLSALRDGCHWLKVRWEAGLRLCTVCLSVFPLSPVIWWILLFYSP